MRQESGRSMIEMLGVLAIMGVITVGAISMISYAMRMQKQSRIILLWRLIFRKRPSVMKCTRRIKEPGRECRRSLPRRCPF